MKFNMHSPLLLLSLPLSLIVSCATVPPTTSYHPSESYERVTPSHEAQAQANTNTDAEERVTIAEAKKSQDSSPSSTSTPSTPNRSASASASAASLKKRVHFPKEVTLEYHKTEVGLLEEGPKIPREMRAAWVATVNNLDLPVYDPQEEGVVAKMKRDIDEIIKKTKKTNLNTLFVQVRPSGDLYYRSKLEPWSYWIFHKQGTPPPENFDPLEYWITRAHEEGIRLHAWMNPFRVSTNKMAEAELSSKSLAKKHPSWVRAIGPEEKRFLWLDPGIPKARKYILSLFRELLKNYDIDGLVIDDYFYPYQDYYAEGESFPDAESYTLYQKRGGELTLDDWRRENVNQFVQDAYRLVKQTRKDVLFGISPFGIWRPGYPEQIRGKDSYTEIYTDSRKWLFQGWFDYFIPQLYWPLSPQEQSFTALFSWWQEQNSEKRHLWPGLLLAKKKSGENSYQEESLHQISATRALSTGISTGVALFRFKTLDFIEEERTLTSLLREEVYQKPVLIPQTKWLEEDKELESPSVRIFSFAKGGALVWTPVKGAFNYVVSIQQEGEATDGPNSTAQGRWKSYVLSPSQTLFFITKIPQRVIVSSVDRLGNESPTIFVQNPSPQQGEIIADEILVKSPTDEPVL